MHRDDLVLETVFTATAWCIYRHTKYLEEQVEPMVIFCEVCGGDQSKIKGTYDLYRFLYFLHFEFLIFF